ncbi:MAG: hypothetical protein NC313_17060, partial [Butyrivibrio sp.]|nr:hypothetical protein [Butyrivibrio sp.]
GINIKSHTILSMLLLAFVLSLCFGTVKMTAHADNANFVISAQLMPLNDETFDISVTIENRGDDWEGVARLKVQRNYNVYSNCAYDTAISMPQGSVKQFVVKVPRRSYTSSYIMDSIKISLLDRDLNTVFSREFNRLLLEQIDTLKMGILSDNYSALTFMDMGGDKLDYYDGSYPIKLVEINQDNLSDSLEALDFLVIDNYNTGVLTSDETAALEKWNKDGGVLIVGTGERAQDTLAGLGYLDVRYIDMYEEEDVPIQWKSWFNSTGEMEFAVLDYNVFSYDYSYYEDSYNAAMMTYNGDGAIGVLPYSLTELGKLDGDDYFMTQNDYIYQVLNSISANANRRYDSVTASNDKVAYTSDRFLCMLGNGNDSLSFGLLKIIIVIYVILAGPILYLILRSLKKRDLYWLTVPALAFMGVIIVMFAGRGLEVVRTRVYSVTVCNLSEPDDCITYLHCYDAGHNEWQLRLCEDYEYAAMTLNSAYNGNGDSDYHYRVLKEGERLFFGVRPDTSFEDVYFYTGKKAGAQSMGSIECNAPLHMYNMEVNRIANNTEYDFEYLAVIAENYLWVYDGLAAGETCNPSKMKEIFQVETDSYYYYDYMSKAQETLKADNNDIMAALGVGINTAYGSLRTGEIAVVGVTSDFTKAVDDNCKEKAYGCFYIIQ